MKYHKNNKCRICSSKNLELTLDLGKQPLANAFIKKRDIKKNENKFPLRLFLCKNCYLLQLIDIVNKEFLFKQYLYMTSASKPIVNHFKKYALEIHKKYLKNVDNPLVIEIGSNDGSLLQEFKKLGNNVLGIEPAKNIAKIAKNHGIPTKNEFLNYKIAKKIAKNNKATLIVANNVIGHIDNLLEFMECMKLLLSDNGILVFEVPYVVDLIQKLEFDTVYHEHLSYFALGPLKKMMVNNGFEIFDVKKQKVHGGTIRVFVSRKNNFKPTIRLQKMIKCEKEFGIFKIKTYQRFTKDVEKLKKILTNKLIKFKKEGKFIFGYGAPAKGNVLLNYCNIDTKFLEYVLDTTPLKHGLLTPGMHIPVKPAKSRLDNTSKQIALLLAWNYKKEILEKENEFRKKGGKFLVPIPSPKLT